ncbi:MAG TPA: hypothetical protein VGU27_01625, partial [Candidatus Eisenbacteria bacterium]|nr:hypothetical protein [Candidatus Eisenbacteria bacterium]
LAAAAAAVVSAPAVAAIRLDEVNLGWSTGRCVCWIDLGAAGGELLDPTAGLSALDHDGRPLWDIPVVFGSYRGSRWQQGRRFLIGTANLTAAVPEFLIGPNALMPTPLDTLGGTITFYQRSATGVVTVLDQLQYGGPGQPGVPPAGTSFKRTPVGGWAWNLSPEPQNFDELWSASDATCFAYPSFFVSQVFLTCTNGGSNEQYVQLRSSSPTPVLDPRLRLRYYDSRGALLADVAHPFGAATGQPGGRWLLGGPTFVSVPGVGVDATLPVPLDPAGGSIQLVATVDGLPPAIEDTLAYGTATIGVPPNGDAFGHTGAFAAPRVAAPQPQNSAGQWVPLPGCANVTAPPGLYLREVALQCEDGGTSGQFVEIAAQGGSFVMSANYHLRAFDRSGALSFDLPQVFGARTNTYMPSPGGFLVASAGYPPFTDRAPDAALPAALDTLAGRLELVLAGPTGNSVVSVLVWGAPLPRPLPGTSLTTDGVRTAIATEPNPVNGDGKSLRLVGCHYGGPAHGFVVGQVAMQCLDGSPDGMFVELQSAAANEYRDPTLGLRVVPAADPPLSVFPLFPVGHPSWPAGGHWLVAGPGFSARVGLTPDLTLPQATSPDGGRIEIFHRNPVTLTDSVLVTLALPARAVPAGRAFARGPTGAYAVAATATPQRFDGAQAGAPGCYATPNAGAVAIAELMLRCRDGDAGGQFVRLVATDPGAFYSPDMVVRALDAHGALLGELTHPYTAVEGQLWRNGTSFLVGGPALRTSLGVTPDATLPAALDTTGGTLQLVLREPDGDHLVDSLVYGQLGYGPPPAGGSLARGAGAFAVRSLPTLTGFAGPFAPDLGCVGVCPARQVRLALGTEQVLEQPSADIASFQSRVSFDAAAGTLALASGYNQVLATLPDRYRVVGGPPDSAFTFTARLLIAATVSESCYFQGRCAAPGVNVSLIAAGVGDSVALVRDSTFALAVPVEAAAGTAFDLTVASRMSGYLSP